MTRVGVGVGARAGQGVEKSWRRGAYSQRYSDSVRCKETHNWDKTGACTPPCSDMASPSFTSRW